jgi:hypothetical protein
MIKLYASAGEESRFDRPIRQVSLRPRTTQVSAAALVTTVHGGRESVQFSALF